MLLTQFIVLTRTIFTAWLLSNSYGPWRYFVYMLHHSTWSDTRYTSSHLTVQLGQTHVTYRRSTLLSDNLLIIVHSTHCPFMQLGHTTCHRGYYLHWGDTRYTTFAPFPFLL